MTLTKHLAAAFLCCFLAAASTAGAKTPKHSPHYRITPFDIYFVVEGSHCLNSAGIIVGSKSVPQKPHSDALNRQTYLWKNGVLKSLGITEDELASSEPSAINDRGQVVGTLDKGTGFQNMHSWGHAFLWERGHWQDLNPLMTGEVSAATAINNKGEITISTQSSSMISMDDPHREQQQPCYLYRKGQGLTLLGYGGVVALNNNSQILLNNWWSEGSKYSLWDSGKTTVLTAPELAGGTLRGMNDHLQIIGQQGDRAFLYENGHLTYLGQSKDNYAASLNNKGQIVGYYYLPRVAGKKPVQHAFLWQKGKFSDLNRLISPKRGWVFRDASCINDRGQIVGTGTYRGKYSGFLLTPVR